MLFLDVRVYGIYGATSCSTGRLRAGPHKYEAIISGPKTVDYNIPNEKDTTNQHDIRATAGADGAAGEQEVVEGPQVPPLPRPVSLSVAANNRTRLHARRRPRGQADGDAQEVRGHVQAGHWRPPNHHAVQARADQGGIHQGGVQRQNLERDSSVAGSVR